MPEKAFFLLTLTGKAGKQRLTLRGPVPAGAIGAVNTLVGGNPIKGKRQRGDSFGSPLVNKVTIVRANHALYIRTQP
jgi:hypothetical protein